MEKRLILKNTSENFGKPLAILKLAYGNPRKKVEQDRMEHLKNK